MPSKNFAHEVSRFLLYRSAGRQWVNREPSILTAAAYLVGQLVGTTETLQKLEEPTDA
jgi:hypothetical protein